MIIKVELTGIMHSQSILRPAVENSNVVCHDTRFMQGRLAKKVGQTLLLDNDIPPEKKNRANGRCPLYDNGNGKPDSNSIFLRLCMS